MTTPRIIADYLVELEVRRGTLTHTQDGTTRTWLADLGQGPLPEGTRYHCLPSPYAATLVVTDKARGRVLGLAPTWEKSARADLEAQARRHGHVQAQYQQATAEAARLLGHPHLARTQANTATLRRLPGPLHPTPKLATRGQFDPTTDDLLTPEETPATTHTPTQADDDLFG